MGVEKVLRRVETREGGWVGGRKPSVSCFDVREGGGAGESPPLHQNTRGRVDGWQEAPPSHILMRRRVVGLEKALRRVETRGGWAGGRKPLRLTFRRDGGFVVVLEGCGGWEGTLGRGGDRNSTRWRVKSSAGLAVGCQ